jgi:hypothetical protein
MYIGCIFSLSCARIKSTVSTLPYTPLSTSLYALYLHDFLYSPNPLSNLHTLPPLSRLTLDILE